MERRVRSTRKAPSSWHAPSAWYEICSIVVVGNLDVSPVFFCNLYPDLSRLTVRLCCSKSLSLQAKKAAHSTFGNKLVSQLALLGHSAQQDSTEGVNQRRHLLQASRDVDQWLTLFMAISVGFVLVVIALISISCMFSMDIKQDTILYGKGKTD